MLAVAYGTRTYTGPSNIKCSSVMAGFISFLVPGVCKLTKRVTNMRLEVSPIYIARSQIPQGGIIF